MADENRALPSVEAKQVESVERQVRRVVDALHTLASRIQMQAENAISDARRHSSEYASYSYAASSVVHEIQWGVANLPLGQLVTDAATADVYAERARTATEA